MFSRFVVALHALVLQCFVFFCGRIVFRCIDDITLCSLHMSRWTFGFFLAVTNNTASEICVQIFMCGHRLLISLCIYLGLEFLGYLVFLCLSICDC